MLVARYGERKVLGDAIADARAGIAAAVLLVGEPGIGKSALIDDLVGRIPDALILRVVGSEAERDIPLAGLISMMQPFQHNISAAASPCRDAMVSMLTTGQPVPIATMGLELLEFLSVSGDDRLVVVLLDDLHWIDQASIDVIQFARRRLGRQRVVLVGAQRSEFRLWNCDGPVLHLEGLDAEHTQVLLARTGAIDPAVAEQCRSATAGNPLSLLEIGRTLTTRQRTGDAPLPEVLPAGARLHDWLLDRVRELPERTQRALIAFALSGSVSAAVLDETLAELHLGLADLDVAERTGVVRRDRALVEFVHPLYASATVTGADPIARRAAHRAIAAVQVDQLPERRAWHLSQGGDNRDGEVSQALKALAERASVQGTHLAASAVWERVAALSVDAVDRSVALTAAGTAAWDAGRPDLALPLLESARSLTGPGGPRASATEALADVIGWTTSVTDAIQLLQAEASLVLKSHPAAASSLLVSATRLATLAASPLAVEIANQAERIANDCDELTRITARTVSTHARLLAGDGVVLDDRLAELEFVAEIVSGRIPRPLIELAHLIGFDLMVRERWDESAATFDRAVEAARRYVLPGEELFALAMNAEVAWRRGRWVQARGTAAADALFHSRDGLIFGTFADATSARVEAALGLDTSARRAAKLAVDRGDAISMTSLSAWGRHAIGLADLAAGAFDEAATALNWIWRLAQSGGATDPGVLWWHGDFLEALVATDERRQAVRLVEELDDSAQATGRVWAAAIAARGRALLHGDLVSAHQSVSLLDRLGAPFEAARSRLVLAELLDAPDRDEVMEVARATFERLGARPWVARTTSELKGEPAPADSLAALLTPAELRIAAHVAQGLTNREVATALALSPRTVDAHLQATYRKLDIRSRSQLIIRMGSVGA